MSASVTQISNHAAVFAGRVSNAIDDALENDVDLMAMIGILELQKSALLASVFEVEDE